MYFPQVLPGGITSCFSQVAPFIVLIACCFGFLCCRSPAVAAIVSHAARKVEGLYHQPRNRDSAGSEEQRKPIFKTLRCSITGKLPFDPVWSANGDLCDRPALEKHIHSQPRGGEIMSPTKANEPMGKKIRAAPEIKAIIKELIDDGIITGELVRDWREKERQARSLDELRKDATEKNDVSAMIALGEHYLKKQDYKQAFPWFDEGRRNGSIIGRAWVGYMLCNELGVSRNMKEGLVNLAKAAGAGSDLACYWLALARAEEKYGARLDTDEARELLVECLSGKCAHKHMSNDDKIAAKEKLEELNDRRRSASNETPLMISEES